MMLMLGYLRSNYFDACDCLVFVIDSSDRRRLQESAGELLALLDDEKLVKVPLLVYANKQDLMQVNSGESTLCHSILH